MPTSDSQPLRSGLLALRTEEEDGVRILRLAGELDLANAELLEAEMNAALSDDSSTVVIDLAELTFIDSTGIAILVSAMTCDDTSSKLRFIPSRATAVIKVLRLTGVDERMALADGG